MGCRPGSGNHEFPADNMKRQHKTNSQLGKTSNECKTRLEICKLAGWAMAISTCSMQTQTTCKRALKILNTQPANGPCNFSTQAKLASGALEELKCQQHSNDQRRNTNKKQIGSHVCNHTSHLSTSNCYLFRLLQTGTLMPK